MYFVQVSVFSTDDTTHSRSISASIIFIVHAAFDLVPDSKHLNRHRKTFIRYTLFISFKNFAHILGALYPYCEISVNSLIFRTPYFKCNNSVQWHSEFNFTLTNIVDDVIHINIFDHEYFSPNRKSS